MDLSEAERLIAASPDHRLLRRVPPVAEWNLVPPHGETRRALLVDTETTGLDPDADEVIELALLPFEYERDTGRVVAVDEANALSASREPSMPIPPEATKLHGISSEMIKGHSIDAERVNRIVEPTHLIIAHNAAFDRPMVERHWPIFDDKHWACSFVDVDWKAEGIGSASSTTCSMPKAGFMRATGRCRTRWRRCFLLTRPLPQSKDLALSSLLRCARRPLRAVRAEETAFEQRAALKARGYRWDEGQGKRTKAWWIMTNDPDAEIAWLRSEIYRAEREIPAINVPPTRRYSARLWPR